MKTAPTAAWTQLKPHATQASLWRTRARFVAVWAGRGSGKTEIAKRRLVRMLAVPHGPDGGRYFYGAPTEGQAKRIAWDHLLALTPRRQIAQIKLAELTIISRYGVSLSVVGLDAPQRIEGVQWNGAVIDESSDIKPGTFARSVLPALSWRRGWCWRIGVPKRYGVGAAEFRKFCDDSLSGDNADAAGFTWPAADIVPAGVLEAARRVMDAKDYREQFEASWETAGGGIFWAFSRETNVRPVEYRPDLPLVVGCDFNVDPMAWCIGHRYADRMEWFDEIWLRDTNTVEALRVLRERYGAHRAAFEFYPDASAKARKTSAAESDLKLILGDPFFAARGRNVFIPAANPPTADRFADCNAMFRNAAGKTRMWVSPHCKRLIADLEARHYKPGTNEVADGGDLGHMSDAMGYAVSYLFPIRFPALSSDPVVTILTG